VAEVDEDAHEEFEAPGNVIPSQPELQNVKVVGHSSIQPQDFHGVTGEHQLNSSKEDNRTLYCWTLAESLPDRF